VTNATSWSEVQTQVLQEVVADLQKVMAFRLSLSERLLDKGRECLLIQQFQQVFDSDAHRG
jgi:hypothetical protein